jgi:hypothetical protein
MYIHEELERLSFFQTNGERNIQGLTGQKLLISIWSWQIKKLPFLKHLILAQHEIPPS